MKILGVDIGICNLALCVLEFQSSIFDFQIILWELLDISCSLKCENVLRNGKICNKKASKMSESGKAYCSVHGKKEICHKISNKTNLLFLTRNLQNTLKNYLDILQTCDWVYIENQPALKNPLMKTLSVVFYAYLAEHLNIKHIYFINASNKLKLNEQMTKEYLKSRKNKYQARKQLSIIYVQMILENAGMNDYEISSSKKDDLCDAFLYAFYAYSGKNCLV